MISKESEIVNALSKGKDILVKKPELYDKTINEVLDILDDGTKEMRHYRWGCSCICCFT